MSFLETENSFKPQPVDCDTIILIIKHLKQTNSYGSDGIPLRFILDSLPVTILYITIIINTSIVTCVFPDLWKWPHVIPLFKGGDKDDVGNYRPISLLTVLSKILEKIIATQLMSYLESNNLLSENQHGFRPKLSTETALMQVTDRIYDNIDRNKISLLLLLDLSKAFDSVSHKILINKCIEFKIDPSWFQSYLSNRQQSVRIGSSLSSKELVSFGVPQGSILGPLLFLIYVNDLPKNFDDGLTVQYADDSQFILTGETENIENLTARAENTLFKAKQYFLKNGLMVNEKKTQVIFIGSRNCISKLPQNISLNFDDNTILPSKCVKNLGVYFDNVMLFNNHIDEMSKKVTGTLIYLNRIKDNFETSVLIVIVQSLALSLIYYCSNVWGYTNKTQLERVQKLQNFAAKVAIGGASKYDHATPIIKKLEWLRIEEQVFL